MYSIYKIFIKILLKNDILNPVDSLAKKKIKKFYQMEIKNLKIGKYIKFKIKRNTSQEKTLKQDVELLCEQFFSNKSIEKYQYYIKKIKLKENL